MVSEEGRRYRALVARDARFDGVLFVGVTSTGIYCRPICPAKTPRESNCRFFDSPQEAEHADFRPCLRCRPELAPGNAPVDDAGRIARLILQRLEEGNFDEKTSLEALADQFELSSRQVRRIVQKELGVPPIQLLLTRRLLLAKQLLSETSLPIVEIAFASGFSSVRRFNDAFRERYGMPPTRLRKKVNEEPKAALGPTTSTLQLAYRAPYDWHAILEFLRARALVGVEFVTDDSYARTVELGDARGWVRVTPAHTKHTLLVEFSHGLTAVLPALLGRVRALFDLDARPDAIARHLSRDARLAEAVRVRPGLRVPGAFHGFELGVRAILGQQVTVKAATTLSCRFVDAFGEPFETPLPELTRLTPRASRVAQASVDEISRLGIIASRARSLIALAAGEEAGELRLEGGRPESTDEFAARLVALPGIGSWTAHYMAMRVLRSPDAFPKEDIVVRQRLGEVTARQAEEASQAWRPWRSYAVMHLWSLPRWVE